MPQSLSYPSWLSGKYPDIAKHSVWVETTRYVGVIGGAGFDYLAYTSWLRQKGWGMSSRRATPADLQAIAADPHHEQRRWLRARLSMVRSASRWWWHSARFSSHVGQ